MGTKQSRISKREKSRILNNIYGSIYNNYQMPHSSDPKIRQQAVKLIDQLCDSKHTKSDLEHESSLVRVNELHSLLSKVMESIRTNTDGMLLTINKAKFNRMNDTIRGYNQYVATNDLFAMKYKPLDTIELPQNVIFYKYDTIVKRDIKEMTNVGIRTSNCSIQTRGCDKCDKCVNLQPCNNLILVHSVHKDVFTNKRLML